MKRGDIVYHKAYRIRMVLLEDAMGDEPICVRYWNEKTGKFETTEIFPWEVLTEAEYEKEMQKITNMIRCLNI